MQGIAEGSKQIIEKFENRWTRHMTEQLREDEPSPI